MQKRNNYNKVNDLSLIKEKKMLGDLIKNKRIALNLSQSKLGEITNIPQTSISDIEKNKYIPKIDVCLKLAETLTISVSDLLKTLDEHKK